MGNIEPIVTISDGDLWDSLKGLRTGRYLTEDLHQRYVTWAKSRGLEPVGKIQFGMKLGRERMDRKVIKGKGTWFIDADMISGRGWFKSSEASPTEMPSDSRTLGP